jgi:hypothetical protein
VSRILGIIRLIGKATALPLPAPADRAEDRFRTGLGLVVAILARVAVAQPLDFSRRGGDLYCAEDASIASHLAHYPV